jgi:predicted 2-oxoglutarate/Fe(II)-dependent dioxygenase YbiX
MENLPLPTKVYHGAVEIYENIWSDPQKTIEVLESEIKNSEELAWERSDVRAIDGYSGYGDARTNLEFKITEYAEKGNRFSQALHNQIADLMDHTTQSYMYRHKIYGIKYHHEYYHVLKYSDNQKFDAHVDGMPGSKRFLSAILYLNNDYEGGELEFVHFNLKLKLNPGSLILFPSYFSHAHIAHPVTQGNKYAVVSWLDHEQP